MEGTGHTLSYTEAWKTATHIYGFHIGLAHGTARLLLLYIITAIQ